MRWWLLLVVTGCASARVASQEETGPGTACPPGVLTYVCREQEWPLLREDPQAALAELDDRCSTQSDGWACLELGLALSRWRNLPRDETRALDAFESACTRHVGPGCAGAGLMHEAGRGTKRSVDRAVGFYGRGCLLGFKPACADQRRLRRYEAEPLAHAMEQQRGPVQYCFAFAVERDQELASKTSRLEVEFELDAAGRPGPSRVGGTLDEPLAFCVSEAVQTFTLPPSAGAPVRTKYTYVFPPSYSVEDRTIKPGGRAAIPSGTGPDERLNAPQRSGLPVRRR